MGPFENLFSYSVCYVTKYTESRWAAGTVASGEWGLTPCCAAKPPLGPGWDQSDHAGHHHTDPPALLCLK